MGKSGQTDSVVFTFCRLGLACTLVEAVRFPFFSIFTYTWPKIVGLASSRNSCAEILRWRCDRAEKSLIDSTMILIPGLLLYNIGQDNNNNSQGNVPSTQDQLRCNVKPTEWTYDRWMSHVEITHSYGTTLASAKPHAFSWCKWAHETRNEPVKKLYPLQSHLWRFSSNFELLFLSIISSSI